jgi:hypothetical protein
MSSSCIGIGPQKKRPAEAGLSHSENSQQPKQATRSRRIWGVPARISQLERFLVRVSWPCAWPWPSNRELHERPNGDCLPALGLPRGGTASDHLVGFRFGRSSVPPWWRWWQGAQRKNSAGGRSSTNVHRPTKLVRIDGALVPLATRGLPWTKQSAERSKKKPRPRPRLILNHADKRRMGSTRDGHDL